MTTQRHERIPEWTQGDRLRKARSTTGKTVAEFAEHIGVSDRTINHAENDKRGVRKITLNAWSLATGVPVNWLVTGEVDDDNGPDDGATVTGPAGGPLPRLDSNQEPSDFTYAQVNPLFHDAA
jgi:transcriptional regulator with XRE-family HTH domain